MNVKATYTFYDNNMGTREEYHIYMPVGGHPAQALVSIKKAQVFSWPLPRFAATEFSAAFVRAHKEKPGDVYIIKSKNTQIDISYRYEITSKGDSLFIKIFDVYWDDSLKKQKENLFFEGTTDELDNYIQIRSGKSSASSSEEYDNKQGVKFLDFKNLNFGFSEE